jgi:hypothetical protein
MYQAACKIGSHAGFFCVRSSVKSQLGRLRRIQKLSFTGKILPVCFPAFLRPAFPGLPVLRSGLLGSRKKQEKASSKNAKKAPKTEHKNVGLYAQKTPHSAY